MKELKFRAWDKKEKRMCYGIDGDDDPCWRDGDCFGHVEMVNFELSNCYYIYIWEQYTGLKDKNNKEIYEGDIIQEEIESNYELTDGVFKYEVYWNNDTLSWGLKPITLSSIHDELWETNQSVEVIGNIHENPELLEIK